MNIGDNPENIMFHQDKIRKELIEKAEKRDTISYSDLFSPYGLDMSDISHRNAASHLLFCISKEEKSEGRPLLSVLVVNKSGENKGQPGSGFYEMMAELGIIASANVSDDKKIEWFVKEVNKVHDYWANQ